MKRVLRAPCCIVNRRRKWKIIRGNCVSVKKRGEANRHRRKTSKAAFKTKSINGFICVSANACRGISLPIYLDRNIIRLFFARFMKQKKKAIEETKKNTLNSSEFQFFVVEYQQIVNRNIIFGAQRGDTTARI